DTLATDVGDGKDESPVVQLDNVVVVSADAMRRYARCGKFQPAACRELAGEKRKLDLQRKAEFGFFPGELDPAGLEVHADPVEAHGKDNHGCSPSKGETPRNQDRALQEIAAGKEQSPCPKQKGDQIDPVAMDRQCRLPNLNQFARSGPVYRAAAIKTSASNEARNTTRSNLCFIAIPWG